RALTAGVEAQKFMLKSEKSHYLPKVQAFASARFDNIFKANTDMAGPVAMEMNIDNIGLGPTLMAGVGFKWELFNPSGGSPKVHYRHWHICRYSPRTPYFRYPGSPRPKTAGCIAAGY
ncbi:MAG: hypothetical protein ACOYN4_20055, partial [Bacteroidales bacterium]